MTLATDIISRTTSEENILTSDHEGAGSHESTVEAYTFGRHHGVIMVGIISSFTTRWRWAS